MTTDFKDFGGLGRRTRLPLFGDGRKQLPKWKLGNLLRFLFLQDCCQEMMGLNGLQERGGRRALVRGEPQPFLQMPAEF